MINQSLSKDITAADNKMPDFILHQGHLTDEEFIALSIVLAVMVDIPPHLSNSAKGPRSQPASRRWGRATRQQQTKLTRAAPYPSGLCRWGRSSGY